MSRCFSYPPPGYVLSSAKKEALIELIKLQEENLRKKEKKERKKREREQNRKDEANPKLEKSNIRSSQNGLTNTKSEFFRNEKEEHSGLTEEHKCPTGFSVPSSSSESTEKSKKRKSNEQQPCSTSEWSDTSDGTSRDKSSKSTAQNTEQICSTSGRTETDNKRTFPKKAVLTPIQKLDLQYTSLLVDCFSLPVQDVCAFPTDNLDWLLNQETRAGKKSRFGNESLSCCRSFGLWPRAEYLPEVGMYALPYTVPY